MRKYPHSLYSNEGVGVLALLILVAALLHMFKG